MTTEVIVKANHGWPVDATRTHVGTLKPMYAKERVAAGVTRTFSVRGGARPADPRGAARRTGA